MDLLPEELVADILRHLPSCPLAVCRRVCKDLCATIDGHVLLLALSHRVPRSLRGIFINYVGQDRPYFFYWRAVAPPIGRELSFIPGDNDDYGWQGSAPKQPRKLEIPNDVIFRKTRCPSSEDKYNHEVDIKGSLQWPPSVYVAQVFSSRTSL
ncbi:unnamed protein product [Urochloa humidicola]